MSGPGPYGPGPRSDPRDDSGARRDVPFGPNISWPNGFRRLDAESRRVLESGYGSGGYRPGQYDPVDPRRGAGAAGYAGSGYQQPAMDDYGYGDPGYSDPSYDGPRNPHTGPMRQLGPTGPRAAGGPPAADGYGYGHQDARTGWPPVHDHRDSTPPGGAGYQPGFTVPSPGAQGTYPLAGSGEIYPVTGAQEALPATGPQPMAGYWAAQGPASAEPGSRGYPDQRYDAPRPGAHAADGPQYDDPREQAGRPRLDDPRATGPRPGGAHATDPRLEGIRYDELRYDEPTYDDEPSYGASRYDQSGDDVSWYEELRRSAPVYPDRPSGPPAGGQRPADPPRHGDRRAPAHGQPPGYPQSPAREQPPGPSGPSGYGQARDDRGRPGPQMHAGREISPGPRPGTGRQPLPPSSQGPVFHDGGYVETAVSRVIVLAPAVTGRVYALQEDSVFAAATAGPLLAPPPVRPGHGLDGPEITASWPAQPEADDLEAFEDFWREDDEDEEYRGLFGEDDLGGGSAAASRQAPRRRTGRRRGRSSDHRLWLALAGVVIAASAAIIGIIKFEFPSHSGPAHIMQTPPRIGTYLRTEGMERQANVAQLRAEVIKMSAGQARDVVSAVYESGDSAAGSTEQIIMFIGGHLANAAPATSIADFTQKFVGATVVSAGSLGGQAACVEEGSGPADPVAMCVWFDNDSFGEMVSPTMNATSLAGAMLTLRPDLEIVKG